MPRTLKADVIRHLGASTAALRVGLRLLGEPYSASNGPSVADLSIPMGLVGASGELAITACLLQARGRKAIVRPGTGTYLNFGESIRKFRILLKEADAATLLAPGVDDAEAHLQRLDQFARSLQPLSPLRADALHCGFGPSRDVICAGAWSVVGLIETLGVSPKWRSYVADVPQPPPLLRERRMIAEDIARHISQDVNIARHQLLQLYLVLPEVTEDEPVWISTFDRVQITPKKSDISYLCRSLERAGVVDLVRVGRSADTHAVRSDPSDPNAIPVRSTTIRQRFSSWIERWEYHVAAANDALESGSLDVPGLDAICAMASLGVDGIGLTENVNEGGLSAHAVWPFIAGALYTPGTPGPCFWIVRQLSSGSFGQLRALLDRATSLSGRLQGRVASYLPLLQAVDQGRSCAPTEGQADELSEAVAIRRSLSASLVSDLRRRLLRTDGAAEAGMGLVIGGLESGTPLAQVMQRVADGDIVLAQHKLPVLRTLVGAASDWCDLPVLAKLMHGADLGDVKTAARKAIRDIDFMTFGPSVEVVE